MKTYFELDEDIIHLNHAAVGPWPIATARAVSAFADENARIGSRNYEAWLASENQLRNKLARLINAGSADDIALLKSTSEGLSFIAHGLDWNAGDNIVIPAEEFPSNRIVWESLKNRGVEVRPVPVCDTETPEQALVDAFDNNTRLLSVSSVQYARGLRLALQQLGKACKNHDVLFCVDAIQSLGAMQFDLQSVDADFVVADGHKWMLGPEGLALFYCRESVRERIELHEYGWHMVENPGDFDTPEWKPATTARRFECGSPNMTATVALSTSLDVLFDTGMEKVEQLVMNKSRLLYDELSRINGLQLLTPASPARRAGIVTFSVNPAINEPLYAHLQQQGVICAPRGGGIRLSPHFHTREEQLLDTVKLINDYLE